MSDPGPHTAVLRRAVSIVLAAAIALLTGACAGSSGRPELVIGVAASLGPLFEELGTSFADRHEIDVTIVPSASGTLAHQIEQGAPIDVYVSADASFVERLQEQGLLVADTVTIFGEGMVVVVRPREPAPGRTARSELLVKAGRVAIANPEIAPYGAAAKALLEANGLWDDIEPRVVYGESAMQVLQFVKADAVDFGFVPLTLVVNGEEGVERMEHDLPTAILNGLLSNTAAMVSASLQEREARLFLAFLEGTEARAAIDRSGLYVVEHLGALKGG